MGRMLYSHYADNVAPNATVSVNSGTVDATYPAANLVDRILGKPAQLTTTTGSWVLDYGAAQRVDWVLLPMHNLIAGLEVRIQGNATDSWGTPTLNQTITIPTYRGDGFPVPCWQLLTGATGYTTGGFRYWRLVVVGTNSAAVKVGEFLMFDQVRTLNPNISWGVQMPEDWPLIDNRTSAGIDNVYDYGTLARQLNGDLDTTDAGLAAVRAWWQSCRGKVRPFGLVPDEDVNEAWVARFTNSLDPTLAINDRNTMALGFEEVGRGLVL